MNLSLPQKVGNRRGFTLIELMVVIVILGILAGLIVPRIMGRPEQAKQVKARMQIESISTALKLYKLDNGMYPSTDPGPGGAAHLGQHSQKLAQGRISGKGQGAQRSLGQ